MKENNFIDKDLGGKIEKIQIPDDDVTGWITPLIEAGYSEEEREKFLIRLNKTYRDIKISREDQIRNEIKMFEDEIYKKHKYILNYKQRERLRRTIELRLDLEKADIK